ncbi:hypothetical protein Q361_10938 [Flavobacterium croceum DSM 17960]|uniref:DUF1204 domain-containing protein n=1 Tax=Flavobacterium croceum DSM 17960 TaxID=1121886 RepID=A0A2S4N787_9FLAO|nr:DUF1204 domain-containing protein [Flavobacterium croceum]POS01578.1 hypothetical protein Q361_10938 [Flavobacterium croceum DSM 17960]
MESNTKKENLYKAIIAILSILLVCSIVYIIKLSNDSNELTSEVSHIKSEKEQLLADLQKTKEQYDNAIAQNTTMTDELEAERNKVVELMEKIKKAEGDSTTLKKYKSDYAVLQTKMKSLIKEVETLKSQNNKLTTDLDSTKVILREAKEYNQVLTSKNDELNKTVEKGSKLSILNLTSAAYKQRSSGKQIATEKARKADLLKISFTIAENAIAKAGDKMYYVQIIDAKNNVLGEKTTVNFGDKSLTYSFTTMVQYENKTVQVIKDLTGNEFAPGNYFVNVFDKTELLAKSSFVLK